MSAAREQLAALWTQRAVELMGSVNLSIVQTPENAALVAAAQAIGRAGAFFEAAGELLCGVSSLRAPQSGPWIAKQSGRDWIVVAPSLQDTPGTSCWQADDFAPREQAEAVRDALNRVAGQGAETPEGTKP